MHKSKGFLPFLAGVLVVAALPAGCGGGGDDGDADATIEVLPETLEEEAAAEEDAAGEPEEEPAPDLPVDLPSDAPDGPSNYPPPPYGTLAGDVMKNHQFIGVDNDLVKMSDFYNDASVKLLLIYATAGWCSVCRYESQAIPDYFADYHEQGFEILAAVFEDNEGDPATRSFAQGYATTYGFTFPTVVDNTFQLGIYFDKAATPMNMFVDLTTMKILDIAMGFDYVSDSMRDDIEYYLGKITR